MTAALSTSLAGKTALVTGGSGAVGRGIVEALAQAGAAVAICYNSRPAPAEALAAELSAAGRAVALKSDLSTIAGIGRLLDEAQGALGAIDIVVANAGAPSNQPFAEIDEDDYAAVFDLNARSTFFLMREAARRLPDSGRIINVSSSQTLHPASGFSIYSGSKAAAERFAAVLAVEVGARAITVNSLVVGPLDGGFLDRAPQEEKDRLADGTSLGRLGTPAEVGAVAAFLASDAARLITGQTIVADGGVLRL